jgi:hypothetical protein
MPPIQPPRFTTADIDQVLESIKRLPVIEAQSSDDGGFRLLSKAKTEGPIWYYLTQGHDHYSGLQQSRLTLAGLSSVSEGRIESAELTKAPKFRSRDTYEVSGKLTMPVVSTGEREALNDIATQVAHQHLNDPRLQRLRPVIDLEKLSRLQFEGIQLTQPLAATVEWFDQAVHGLRQHVLKHLKA